MGNINYNEISKIYDDVREQDLPIINNFINELEITKETTILDVGCGTGNYAMALEKITEAKMYGIEPSEGMLLRAKEKKSGIIFKTGSAGEIPYEDRKFEFIYMTDVIHHVPDIVAMFKEFRRVLKEGGKICICTQSHRQIDLRYMSEFFPATAVADKSRYPDVDEIIEAAMKNGLSHLKTEVVCEGDGAELGAEYIELIEKKGFSMLHLIDDAAYRSGLDAVKNAIGNGTIHRKSAGGTLVWICQ